MKFECKSPVLIKSIRQVSKAKSKQKSQSYLQDIHVELENHLLTIRATNLELFCEKTIPVKGIINGKCILQGESILRIISVFQSEDIILYCELNDGVFSIKTENSLIEIKTTNYEDFPTLPPQGEDLGEIEKETFIDLIKSVSFCSATTEIKPEISSVFIYTKDNFLYSVATDSYRLAEKKVENINNLNISFMIPEKHIGDIVQIINEEEGVLSISKKENIVTLGNSNLTLSIQTIVGNFPDYKQLFPKDFTTSAVMDKNELQKAITLSTFFNENYSQLELIVSENKTTIHSKSESLGQVTKTIESKKEGDDIESKYNNKYFLDVLPYIQGENIECKWTTPNKPMFIQSKADISFIYLLMPLNK